MASNVLTSRTIRGITYNQGDSFICASSVKGNAGSEGDGVSAAALTVGNKYYFLGYAVAADSGTTIKYPCRIGSGSSVSSAIGYYPESVFPYATYTIKYNANGGSGAPSNQTKTYGTDLTISNTKPTRSGYTFKGWSLTNGGSVYYTAGSTCGRNENLTLYAVWEEHKLTVNYYRNNADYAAYKGVEITTDLVHSQDFLYDNSYSSGLANVQNVDYIYLSRTGYAPTGYWNTSSDGSGYGVDHNKSFSTGQALAQAFGKSLASGNASVNVYAQWQENAYTLSYDSNGGFGEINSQTVEWGATFNLSNNTFTREGYKFVGWNAYRNDDNTWYVIGQGWLTEDEITAGGYSKKLYENQCELTFDNSWIRDNEEARLYTMYAVWEISGVVYIDNGTTFEPYLVYIDNGTSWDLYLAYIDNGTSWDIIS